MENYDPDLELGEDIITGSSIQELYDIFTNEKGFTESKACRHIARIKGKSVKIVRFIIFGEGKQSN